MIRIRKPVWLVLALTCLLVCSGLSPEDKDKYEKALADLKNKDSGVRQSAAFTLGELGDPCAIEPLIACLKGPDSAVGIQAAEALTKIDKPAVEPLIDCLKDDNQDVRRNAAWALGILGDQRAVETLIACLMDRNSHVRKNTAEALDKLKWVPPDEQTRITYLIAKQDWKSVVKFGKPAVKPLINCLNDENWNVRYNSAAALGGLSDPRAVEPLIESLKDKIWDVRKSATEALGKLGDKRAVEPLIACLKDQSVEIRYGAAESLGKLCDQNSVEPLIACLKDGDSIARELAVKALGKIGKPAVEPLIAYLKDQDSHVRSGAAEALGILGNPNAVNLLIVCLKDEDSDVRNSAAWALGNLGDTNAVEPLISCLKNEDGSVCYSTVGALGKLGDKRAIPTLVAALPDWEANRTIGEALEKLSWQPQTDREKVYLWICKKDKKSLLEHWEQAEAVLMEDVSSGERRKVENTVFTVISLGKEEMIDKLMQILKERGNKEMAEVYLNCGNRSLSLTAEAWAIRHGYTIFAGSGRTDASWGKW